MGESLDLQRIFLRASGCLSAGMGGYFWPNMGYSWPQNEIGDFKNYFHLNGNYCVIISECQKVGIFPEQAYGSPPHPPCHFCPIESSVYTGLLWKTWTLYKYVVMFGSVWSDQLVLHNYCVIISECQKETFMEKNKVAGLIFLTSMGGWPQRTRGSRRSRSARPLGR